MGPRKGKMQKNALWWNTRVLQRALLVIVLCTLIHSLLWSGDALLTAPRTTSSWWSRRRVGVPESPLASISFPSIVSSSYSDEPSVRHDGSNKRLIFDFFPVPMLANAMADSIGTIPIGRPFKDTVGSAAGCVICHEMIRHALYQIQIYMDVKGKQRLSPYEVEDFMEVICDPYSTEGAWIRQLGFFLVLDEEDAAHNNDNPANAGFLVKEGDIENVYQEEALLHAEGGQAIQEEKDEGEASCRDDGETENPREVEQQEGVEEAVPMSKKVRFEVYGINQLTKCKRTCATIQEKCEFISTYSYFDQFSRTVSNLTKVGKLSTTDNVEQLQKQFCSPYMVCFMKENLQRNINTDLNHPKGTIRQEIENDHLEVIERREYIREFAPMDNMPHRITENYTAEERQKLKAIIKEANEKWEEQQQLENSQCVEDNNEASRDDAKEDL